MDIPLYIMLLIFLFLGSTAALVSQIATARQGLEARVLSSTLRRNYDRLIERNTTRRNRRVERERKLEELRDRQIENVNDKFAADALQQAIEEQQAGIDVLEVTISDSELIITEFDKRIGDVDLQQARSNKFIISVSIAVGGATATIFGFLNYLTDSSALESLSSLVPLSSSVIVQSMALGAGWPLVWEKIQNTANIAEAVTISSEFENRVTSAEKSQV